MSHEDTLEYLRKAPDAERWVWLANKFNEGDGRISSVETVQDAHETRISNIEKREESHRWVAESMRWLLVTMALAVIAALGYFADKFFGGK